MVKKYTKTLKFRQDIDLKSILGGKVGQNQDEKSQAINAS